MARSSTTATAGNSLAVKGGWRSDQIVNQRVPQVLEELEAVIRISVPGYQPADDFTVTLAARRWVQMAQIQEYVDIRREGRWIDRQGRVLKALTYYDRCERGFNQQCDRLGMSPAARGRLAGDLAGVLRNRATAEAQQRLRAKYEEAG